MFIKRITIQGFKTYKNTTIIDDLSPNLNVVIGRNGLGKSNFFSAIRFVLSDAYNHMTREERQGLIHEGSGTVMSAYVEVVFDNSDRRFPIQKDEVSIRRTIGLKKDDYSMDGRSATRSDIMNLLESAGFSRLNPYYIVPQGRITSLTNSKDSERLQLLKEVSGAKMFEAKLRESNKEMAHSQFKMERIDDSMEKLEEKISDLQMELDNLKEYQQLEKNKKIYEFNIFDRELKSLNAQIEEREEEYETIVLNSRNDLVDLEKREEICQNIQLSIDELASSMKLASLEQELCKTDENRVLASLAAKKAEEAALVNRLVSQKTMAGDDALKVDQLSEKVQKNTQLLTESHYPRLAALKEKEAEVAAEITELSNTQRLIFSKQSRFLEFASKSQRDAWLQTEIGTLEEDLSTREQRLESVKQDLKSNEEQHLECVTRLEDLRSTLDDVQNEQSIMVAEEGVHAAKLRVLTLLEEKKQLLREEIKLISLRDSAEHEYANASHKVAQTMDRSQAKALEAVNAITERLNLQDSVFGPLVELFTTSDKYKTAIEVVAGNSLFHIVVDNDETALILMKELSRVKAGRITIMPLNRIHVNPATFPDQEEHEFIPLIKKIKHNHELVGKAIQQVFGKTIICNNLQKGSELARKHGLNAITLDGDRASTKGVLSGGFRQYKHARLDSLKLQSKKKAELTKLNQDLRDYEMRLKDMESDVATATRSLESKTQEFEDLKARLEPQRLEHGKVLTNKLSLEREISTLKKIYETMRLAISSLNSKVKQFREEMASEFTSDLTAEDSRKLEDITTRLPQIEEEYNLIVTQVVVLETEIAEIENISSKYDSQIKTLKESSMSESLKIGETNSRVIKNEILALEIQIEDLGKKTRVAELNLEKIVKDSEKKKKDLEKANKQQAALLLKIEKASKRAEKILVKKAISDKRREELQEKIRALGGLPEEAFDKTTFENITLDEIFRNLDVIHNELKRYAHINKKALEQYNTFAKEREDLISRKHDLENSKESIENLVLSLEQQKDNAIKKSFSEVSRSFSELFEKLVPSGKGELVMRTKSDQDDERDIESIENYTGVSILVSFNSKEDEQQQIEQLSGGQKSLCAITLILAIQKCDPAPFYLFDEIDANLDTQYRTAVAAMVLSLASNAQFICTTFRPEMLQVANTFYGVSFANKVSSVAEIEQEDALTFVEIQR
ncbi:RecF/RecN/SMC protein [Metschnikowia bicuspidata var. bicuspidata NRRL YB-4993]|uniref:Structural maintenance of chromosomes protein n=1 Tax=Metschnikowia bicuspidata var. bicuspidata NRRL YB-4993 TaxID=869754 RepID=A0A1A0HKH9_9ASCO|nr:RecF/RecN/SMC protein [Metschnikowia bicuspidata var. bicuspidata NRRL YB-4993]OBA24313.1 RecF/RecN/SMC protein [Metschnikowia bicuspidata var. bicuspidata NRRL YB-4993]